MNADLYDNLKVSLYARCIIDNLPFFDISVDGKLTDMVYQYLDDEDEDELIAYDTLHKAEYDESFALYFRDVYNRVLTGYAELEHVPKNIAKYIKAIEFEYAHTDGDEIPSITMFIDELNIKYAAEIYEQSLVENKYRINSTLDNKFPKLVDEFIEASRHFKEIKLTIVTEHSTQTMGLTNISNHQNMSYSFTPK